MHEPKSDVLTTVEGTFTAIYFSSFRTVWVLVSGDFWSASHEGQGLRHCSAAGKGHQDHSKAYKGSISLGDCLHFQKVVHFHLGRGRVLQPLGQQLGGKS